VLFLNQENSRPQTVKTEELHRDKQLNSLLQKRRRKHAEKLPLHANLFQENLSGNESKLNIYARPSFVGNKCTLRVEKSGASSGVTVCGNARMMFSRLRPKYFAAPRWRLEFRKLRVGVNL
jgi:hypothetical protein